MQILVLGMHRSGTSMITRLINLMGAYFGPEGSSTGANSENPKGFWERRDVRNINDALLWSMGADWHKVTPFAADRVPDTARMRFDRAVSRLVLELDAHRPWVLKEPRLCLMLPLWREHLEAPVCVFVHRCPLQVARSLQRRNDFPLTFGVALWERYLRDALAASHGLPRIAIQYEAVLDDPQASVRRLRRELARLGVRGLRIPASRELLAFVDPRLHHHREAGEMRDTFLSPGQRQLAQAIEDGSALEWEEIAPLAPGTLKILRDFERQTTPSKLPTRPRTELGKPNRELEPVEHEQHVRTLELEMAQAEINRRVVALDDLHREFEATRKYYAEQVARLEVENATQRAQLDQLRYTPRKLTKLKTAVRELEDAYARRTTKYRKLEQAYARRKTSQKKAEAAYRAILESRTWRVGLTIRSLVRTLTLQHWRSRGSWNPAAEPADRPASPEIAADVVVCVHNALDDARRCLSSLVAHTRRSHRLILVNDGSDGETSSWLRQFKADHEHVTLLESSQPTGYTRAANRGLRAATSELVVLLNSDTIVTEGWLEGLVECVGSSPKIGIVGPLSNAASWQSVPERFGTDGDWAVNSLPATWDANQMARVVDRVSRREFPRVPFVNGFCFAIRRPVIEAIGYLDEQAFPRGYGEENDYCLRAAEAGYELAIADQVYVYHAKSRSYSHEVRRQLAREGSAALKRKHDPTTIERGVARLREHPQLTKIRRRIEDALVANESMRSTRTEESEPLKILFLLPVSGGGGGVHSIVQESIGMRCMGCEAQVAVPRRHLKKFRHRYPTVDPKLFHGFTEERLPAFAGGFDVVVATIFTSVKLLSEIYRNQPQILPAYYIQDYEPWIVEAGTDLEAEARRSYTLIPDMVCFAKTAWLCQKVAEEHGVRVEKVVPSLDTSVYHPSAQLPTRSEGAPIRIAAMVRPKTPRRASKATMEVLRAVQRRVGEHARSTIFGCGADDPAFLELPRDFPFENRGVLLREEVAKLLRASDVFVDFSTYQAFGRTALEAMACDCAVIVPKAGGAGEYAIDGQNALVVDTGSTEAMTAALLQLVENHELRRRLIHAGLQTAFTYSIERAAVSELEVFRAALARRQAPAIVK